ncbi:MAG: hypothetical protein IT449_01470 [Phycisphaerales bacterium]|nr:hypothetical protein [Phycisphaerales bacterium]
MRFFLLIPLASSALLAVGLPCPPIARAELPPGFELVRLTDNPEFEYQPKMNNRGQVVYLRRFGGYAEWDDLFFFDGRRHVRITNDDPATPIRDVTPDINDDGTIVWSRAIGPSGPFGPTLEVMLYSDGQMTRLTDNDTDDWAGSINDLGHVAWDHTFGDGECSPTTDIYVWDGARMERLTWDGEGSQGISNQGPEVNNAGDVIWTRFDFCQHPWASTIQLYRDGRIMQISEGDEYEPNVPAISECGVAAWGSNDRFFDYDWLFTWQDGVRTMLSDWGSHPRINCRGDVYFIRWHGDIDSWQAWYYTNGQFYHLSEERPRWNTNGDINEAGDAVWPSYQSEANADIMLMRANGVKRPRIANQVGQVHADSWNRVSYP